MGIYDGLIGYWLFDEQSGAAVLDRSGLGNDGVLINGDRAAGLYGRSIELKGRDDSHVSIPQSASLNRLTNQITVSAWVFPTTVPDGYKVIVSRQIGAVLHPDQFYLGFGPQNGQMHYKWHMGTDDNGTFREGDLYRGSPESGRWIHMAGTYDGQMIRLYVDGREIGAQPLTGNLRVDDNPVTIGAEENGPDPQVVDGEFSGLIDEVRLYDRALNATEIQSIFDLDALGS